jgi:hypothetical protein
MARKFADGCACLGRVWKAQTKDKAVLDADLVAKMCTQGVRD